MPPAVPDPVDTAGAAPDTAGAAAGGAGHPTDETVLARRAVSMSRRRAWFIENVWATLWFLPLACGTVAFAVTRTSMGATSLAEADGKLADLLELRNTVFIDAAGTIVAAMLTFLAVVFSTTLVAVQLAGSQYSPRVARVFVRARSTRLTLAIFLVTLAVALEVMVADRTGKNPTVFVLAGLLYVMMLTTIVTFVLFLHRIVRSLRVQYLLLWVSRDTRDVLERELPPADAYRPAPAPPDGPGRDLVFRGRPGVVQAVDLHGLCRLARRRDGWIALRVAPGAYVGHGTVLATVHGPGGDLADAELTRHLLIGGERTFIQDPAFGLRQLVDVASRALSPAVNDPTTALQALHRIVDLLHRVATRPDPTGWYHDDAGTARVHLPTSGFERLAVLGLTEILRYGADAPQITRCLAAAYDDLEREAPDRAAFFAGLRLQWDAAVTAAMPPAFVELARRADPDGLG